jgi:hypothetical protein
MIFEVMELITFVFAFIAFIFILSAFFKSMQTAKSKKIWVYFLIIGFFILLNRIFTNIEALFFRDFFNLLEHLCVAAAALTFVFMAWLAYKGGIK